MADPLLEQVEQVYAAIGALRQDIRMVLAALARLEDKVDSAASQGPCKGEACNCHAKDWSDPDDPV